MEGLSKILTMGIADILDLPAAGHEEREHQRHQQLPQAAADSATSLLGLAFPHHQPKAVTLAEQGASRPQQNSVNAAQKGTGKRLGAKRVQPKPRITDDAVPAPDVGAHLSWQQGSSTPHTGNGVGNDNSSPSRRAAHMHDLAMQGSGYADSDLEYQYRRAQAGLTQQKSRGVYDLLMQGVSSFTQKATDLLDNIDSRMDFLFNADTHEHEALEATSNSDTSAAQHAANAAVPAAAAQVVSSRSQGGHHQQHQHGRGKLHACLLNQQHSNQSCATQVQQQQHSTPVKHCSIGLRQPRRSTDTPRIIIPPSPHNKALHSSLQDSTYVKPDLNIDGGADAAAIHPQCPQHADQPAAVADVTDVPSLGCSQGAHGQEVTEVSTQGVQGPGIAIDQVGSAPSVAARQQGPVGIKPAGSSQPPFNASCPGCQHSKKLLIKARKRCSELVEENTKLRGVGLLDPLLADSVCQQLESLLADKARLLADNNRLQRELAGLQQLLAYAWELHTAHLEEHAAATYSPQAQHHMAPDELLHTALQPQQPGAVDSGFSSGQLVGDHCQGDACDSQHSWSCPPCSRQHAFADDSEQHQIAPSSCPQQRCPSNASWVLQDSVQKQECQAPSDGTCQALPDSMQELAGCTDQQQQEEAGEGVLGPGAGEQEWHSLLYTHGDVEQQHDGRCTIDRQHGHLPAPSANLHSTPEPAQRPSVPACHQPGLCTPTNHAPGTPYTPAVAATPSGAHHHEVAPVVQYYEELLAGIARKEPPPPGLDLPHAAAGEVADIPAHCADAAPTTEQGCGSPASVSLPGRLDAAFASVSGATHEGSNTPMASLQGSSAEAGVGSVSHQHTPSCSLAVAFCGKEPQGNGTPTLQTAAVVPPQIQQQPHISCQAAPVMCDQQQCGATDTPTADVTHGSEQQEAAGESRAQQHAVGFTTTPTSEDPEGHRQSSPELLVCADSPQLQDPANPADINADSLLHGQQSSMQAESSSRWGSTCSIHDDVLPQKYSCSDGEEVHALSPACSI